MPHRCRSRRGFLPRAADRFSPSSHTVPADTVPADGVGSPQRAPRHRRLARPGLTDQFEYPPAPIDRLTPSTAVLHCQVRTVKNGVRNGALFPAQGGLFRRQLRHRVAQVRVHSAVGS